ncbi:YtcA family lipoprotein [Terriglobus sp. TAA 43]|uniref:YtcA family lipoprotein n=1 Tax=Terriglobus sp. TAA 43 TaxID=278961 RepID=UPI000648827C|nr:YtcA family lipoprotein [Terriglobus sp. TAA 43]
MKRLTFFAALFLTGCSRNPNVEIVGSYFPGWMISLVIGVALTMLTHLLIRKRYPAQDFGHPALLYPALLTLFTCLLWLLLFA